jgi:ABC-type maltose transport system permease subunit
MKKLIPNRKHLHIVSLSKKILFPFIIILLIVSLSSCTSIRVASDYDKNANFDNYKTFAFYKPGIDKAEINDIDKRRILRAIETQLLAKGYTKSETPDLLVSLFTKSREQVNIQQSGYYPYGYGWGWSPYYWGGYNTITTSTEGVLYIDLIDANKKELVWQGVGTGYLSQNNNKKEECINEFVTSIFEQYPPGVKK